MDGSATRDEQCTVINGRAVYYDQNVKKVSLVTKDNQQQLPAGTVRSPHTTIWAERNVWYVKDRIFRFQCTQLNRYKQSLAFAEYQAVGEYFKTHPVLDNDAVLAHLRQKAYEETEGTYKLEDAEDFVMAMPAE